MIQAKLKDATRSRHEALEEVVDVMSKTFTVQDYAELLGRFYRFYSAVEPNLPAAELAEAGFDIAPRLKTPLLQRDLVHLGTFNAVRGSRPFVSGVGSGGVADAFGTIYVMEGATLGGQVISRHLKERLGISPESGAAFFSSYGSEVGKMWKQFGLAIAAYSKEHPEDDETIVESARETFDAFRRCFEEKLADRSTVEAAA